MSEALLIPIFFLTLSLSHLKNMFVFSSSSIVVGIVGDLSRNF